MAHLLRRIVRAVRFPRSRGPHVVFADLDRLYGDTLWRSAPIRPWAVSGGKYAALELRYEFAREYLRDPGRFDLTHTAYYRFVAAYSREPKPTLYDGNKHYAVVGAEAVSRRYQSLIDSLEKHLGLYNRLTPENILDSYRALEGDIIAFERAHPREVYYLRTGRRAIQPESQRFLSSAMSGGAVRQELARNLMPTAVRVGGVLVVRNGSHRLSAFKAFRDLGRFSNRFPVFVTS